MKRLIAIFLVSIALTACGAKKRLISKEETKTDTKTETTTTTTRTITETAVDTVITRPDSVEVVDEIDILLQGDTLEAETEDTKVTVHINPRTGQIHAKAVSKKKAVPVNINRTTIESEKKHQTASEKSTKKEVKKDTTREPFLGPGTITIIVIFLILLLLLIAILRKWIKV